MIVFCSPNCLNLNDINTDDFRIFNLLSIAEVGTKLYNLIPPFTYTDYSDDNIRFDIDYYNYIISNNLAFVDLMQIMYNEYDRGIDNYSVVLIDNDDIRDSLRDSLIKLIQQRYGINSFIINELDDWNYIESSQATNFDINGIYQFDQDKERYTILNFDEFNHQDELRIKFEQGGYRSKEKRHND